MSALSRMGHGAHQQIVIKKGDTVILSSSPIPGNEKSVYTVINNITRLGAKVYFSQIADVHTSGHASREDLKLMINLVRPKFLIPIHGEIYMRNAHAEIGQSLGMPEGNTLVVENGDILEMKAGEVYRTKEKASANYIMIDGKGIGDIGEQMLMDRQTMAGSGFLVVLFTVDSQSKKLKYDPELVSRGFIHMKDVPQLVAETVAVSKKAFEEAVTRMPNAKRGEIKQYIKGVIDRYSHKKIERQPLVIPIIVEA